MHLCRRGMSSYVPRRDAAQEGLRKKYEARWHSGAARIAHEAAVPLVPAAIAWDGPPQPARSLRVAYGPPLEVGPGAEATTERLREAIESLEASLA